jgi:pyruvate/2-oxoglutarate dehydrogenase complex dihydrolipoamide dehydrogenase (E3) component
MRLAEKLPTQETFLEYLAWQERRLKELGVGVVLGRAATAADVIAHGADVVAIATGSRPRRPEIPGVNGPQVHGAWQVLKGEAGPGKRVAVIGPDDHLPPLSLSDHLAGIGCEVTLICPSHAPASNVSRYSAGGIFARLSRGGVKIVTMQEVVNITLPELTLRHLYSGVESRLGSFDSVALACGGVSETSLHDQLGGKVPELHLLGDAYAPRRNVFATKQGYVLGGMI